MTSIQACNRENQMRTSKFLVRFDLIAMKEITGSIESRLKPHSYYTAFRQYICSSEPGSLTVVFHTLEEIDSHQVALWERGGGWGFCVLLKSLRAYSGKYYQYRWKHCKLGSTQIYVLWKRNYILLSSLIKYKQNKEK